MHWAGTDTSLPRQFLEVRIEAATRSDQAVKRGQRARAHADLRKFWSI